MKRGTLDQAIKDAERFLETAKRLKREDKADFQSFYFWTAARYTAAVKRASMDLTRTLADLRQGR